MEELYQKYLACEQQITTDTRKITKNCLFFALKGENFDGNTFAEEALRLGAAYCVVDDARYANNERCVLVNDVLKTLQALATHHRRQFNVPVFAITGSNGKTTTKELVHRVLAKKYKVTCTEGNLNNHIGVPLTLLRAPLDTTFFVVEMGANHQGEIRDLCEIAEPTHGHITSIGKAHLEGFGGIEGVKKGKGELFDYLAAHDGTVLLNINDAVIAEMAKARPLKNIVLFGNNSKKKYKNLVCEGLLLQANPFVIFRFGGYVTSYMSTIMTAKTQLFGEYNFGNLMTAMAIGFLFEIHPNRFLEAIESYAPDNNRAQFLKKGTNTYILDAYNANPTSMEAGIVQFAAMKAENKAAVLGEMRELGDYAAAEHEKIAALAQTLGVFSQIILVGKQFAPFAALATAYFETAAAAKTYIETQHFEHTHLYLKGSRAVRLEIIV